MSEEANTPINNGQDDVIVVVPAFNEATVISDVLVGLLQEFSRVVVIDDGSSDGTAEIAHRAGVIVLRHIVNLGQGAALRTGIDFAITQHCRYLATFDSDGQHDPADLNRLVTRLRRGDCDIVLGSRFLGTVDNIPKFRYLLLRLAIWFSLWTTNVALTDTHNGLRVMTIETADSLNLRQPRMAHASEIIAKIGQLGLTFSEEPVRIRYTDYSLRKGQSTWQLFTILGDLIAAKVMK